MKSVEELSDDALENVTGGTLDYIDLEQAMRQLKLDNNSL